MPKFETQFKNIVGGKSELEKIKAREELQKSLEETSYKDTNPYEIEPSEKDKKIINFITDSVSKILLSYGVEPTSLPSGKICVVGENSVSKITDDRLREGFHSMLKQRVVVERAKSDTQFALCLAHELLHLKSYKSAQIIRGEVEPYRSGLIIFDRDSSETEYFSELEEAIVAEVTRQLYVNEMKKNSLFKSEIEKTEKIKFWIRKTMEMAKIDEIKQQRILDEVYTIPDADEILEFVENDNEHDEEYKTGFVFGRFQRLAKEEGVIISERYSERKKFNGLLDELIKKSNGKFKNKNELFVEFAKANFSGKLLSLARIVESTLGKGSFRELAEKFKSI